MDCLVMLGVNTSKFSKRMGQTVGHHKTSVNIQLNTEMDKRYQAMKKT